MSLGDVCIMAFGNNHAWQILYVVGKVEILLKAQRVEHAHSRSFGQMESLKDLFLSRQELLASQSEAHSWHRPHQRVCTFAEQPFGIIAMSKDKVRTLALCFKLPDKRPELGNLKPLLCQSEPVILIVDIGIYSLPVQLFFQKLRPPLEHQVRLVGLPHYDDLLLLAAPMARREGNHDQESHQDKMNRCGVSRHFK